MKFFACLLLLVMAMQLHGNLVENNQPLPSPPVALVDNTGKTHSLAQDHGQDHGQVLIVNFQASWCMPCVRELPGFNRLGEHYDNQPFEIPRGNVTERSRRLIR